MRSFFCCLLMFVLSTPLWCVPLAAAHPVSITSTIADVHADRIDVDIEVMLEDLVLYHQLASGEDSHYSVADLKAAVEKHGPFLLKYFSILDGQGQSLKGQVVSVSTDEIGSSAVGQSELMRRTVGFKLQYRLTERPEYLTFLQNFGGPRASVPSVMDLHVLRDGSFGEPGTQITHGRPHTVKLDWTPGTPGKKLSLAEVRSRRKAQLQQRLGIASYTGLFSFLYVNQFEVRHEVLVPLLTLEQWLPIAHEDNDFIEVEEQKAATAAIEKFFTQKQVVEINGQVAQPKISRISFFGLDINDFALGAEPRKINVAQARVGVIVSYPAPASPEQVTITWDAYSENAPYLSSVILIGDQAPQRHEFQSLEKSFKWTGRLAAIPSTPVPANEPIGNTPEGRAAFGQLLTGIYRAFDQRDDAHVYDALSQSVDGPLLRDLYLRMKRSLIMAEQGGTLARIQSVAVSQLEATQGSDAGSFEVTWQAASSAEHWGHVHQRTNQFHARVSLAAVDGHWKLKKFQLLDEKQVKFETSIRGYDSNP